jgi:hypothetical protein
MKLVSHSTCALINHQWRWRHQQHGMKLTMEAYSIDANQMEHCSHLRCLNNDENNNNNNTTTQQHNTTTTNITATTIMCIHQHVCFWFADCLFDRPTDHLIVSYRCWHSCFPMPLLRWHMFLQHQSCQELKQHHNNDLTTTVTATMTMSPNNTDLSVATTVTATPNTNKQQTTNDSDINISTNNIDISFVTIDLHIDSQEFHCCVNHNCNSNYINKWTTSKTAMIVGNFNLVEVYNWFSAAGVQDNGCLYRNRVLAS